jgi:hypothetical protein
VDDAGGGGPIRVTVFGMTWLLRPGAGLARRDDHHLQVGVDPPHVAVLPDSDGVRRLLDELAAGGALSPLDEATTRALDTLVDVGLVVAADAEAARAARRAGCTVHLDVPGSLLPAAVRLLGEAGLTPAGRTAPAAAALVWAPGEVSRDRVDGWMRSGTPHLVVREPPQGPVLGPYVVPGATACLRCVDAAGGDPRRPLVVEQLARAQPHRRPAPDPAARALALAWAVRDLATGAEGGTPASWSATVSLGTLPPVVTAYRRHPHCGCAWDDALTEAGRAARAG